MKPVYFVPTGRRLVALTFDDGPTPGVTDKLIAVMDRLGVKGTFFMVGVEVHKNPSLARDVVLAGNEVATHGHRHRKGMKNWSREDIFDNFKKGKNIVGDTICREPKWMRPPYGNITADMLSVSQELGMVYAGWSLNTEDWFARSWVDSAVRRTIPGTVPVLHDGGRVEPERGAKSARQLGEYIGRLLDAGYSFVTLQELVDAWDVGGEVAVKNNKVLGMRVVEEFEKRWATPMWDVNDLLNGISFSVSAGGCQSPWVIPPMSNVEDWIPRIEIYGLGTPWVSLV